MSGGSGVGLNHMYRQLNQEEAITVSAFGQTKTVQDRQVIIVKPKSGGRTDSAKLTQAIDDVRSALKSICNHTFPVYLISTSLILAKTADMHTDIENEDFRP